MRNFARSDVSANLCYGHIQTNSWPSIRARSSIAGWTKSCWRCGFTPSSATCRSMSVRYRRCLDARCEFPVHADSAPGRPSDPLPLQPSDQPACSVCPRQPIPGGAGRATRRPGNQLTRRSPPAPLRRWLRARSLFAHAGRMRSGRLFCVLFCPSINEGFRYHAAH